MTNAPTVLMQQLDNMVGSYREAVLDERVPAKVRSHDLRHMAFWHGYYAAVVTALAAGEAPDVLRGTYKAINRKAQELNARHDDAALIVMIGQAHACLLQKLPELPGDLRVPYKKGSRDYPRDAYVATITEHFDMHVRYLKKIAAGAPESFHVFHI
ncbi:MAG: hypothetical protein JJ920_03255 [Roseitalea sp.]|jgi:hypothetical protein|nr:hypothetical protein [Roseitalea sp.]MBO6723492.1 hypothetical protein [Roseitalea sp.]MBO6741901.1 hypothetical protein [Roseitalea sp.]